MLFYVIYDISSNSMRTKISEKCKDYGLERVQKSAFLGELTFNEAEMLSIDFKEIVKSEELFSDSDAIFIIPACSECFEKRILIGEVDESFLEKQTVYIIK